MRERMRRQWAVFTGLTMLAALITSTAYAGPLFAAPPERPAAVTPGNVSQDQAAARVQRSTGGRVLSVDTLAEGGRAVHQVKVLLPGGRIRIIAVDGRSGEMR